MVSNPIGKLIKSYEIKELIGTGGFGAVYRARQAVIDREVAIKIIWPAFANHPNFIRRFEAEAQLVAGLEHPYIVPLYDYWRDPDGAYIVMRWLRGGPLRNQLAEGPFSITDATRFMTQTAAALTLAHRYGVVHRDIKPENILLDEEKNVYLADFGIARILSDSQNDELMGLGSPAYAAPEQVIGGYVSAQSDIYSLGIILFELLTGQHPFPHLAELSMTEMNEFRNTAEIPSVVALRNDLPKAIDMVLHKATSLTMENRYPDALAFSQAFQKALNQGRQTIFDTQTTRSQQIIPNPYKGLRSFQETDANIFFGREALVHRLVSRVRESSRFNRFLAIVGPSGSGKSSLIKAGLVPALRQGAMPNSDQWYYDDFAPGNQPFDELVRTVMSIATDITEEDVREKILSSNLGFLEALQQVLPDDETELFLFIDQFEEIFTLVDEEQVTLDFLEAIYTAVTRPDSRVRIVIAIRADFYDRPLLQPFLSDLVRERTEVVVPLSPIELERVIVEPARKVGVTIDNGLVTAIITEVKQQPGALPLLQYALSELFEFRDGTFISAKSYRELGGVRGALARRADELYTSLSPAQKRTTRQLFLRLITLGEGTEDTRRRALLSEITSLNTTEGDSATTREVIEALGSARLVTFDRDPVTRSPTIEVTHEAIIREWSLLRSWLDESRQDVRMQRSLSSLAQEWQTNDRDPSFILRGIRLEQFESWISQTNLVLTHQEREYLHMSIQRRQQEIEQETTRRAREEQLERRSLQRLRLLVGVLGIAVIGAFVLSGFAFNESDRAETALATSDANAVISRSLALEASARRSLNEGDVDLALVLALSANENVELPPVQARSTLSDVAFANGSRAVFTGHTAFVQSVDIDRVRNLVASGSTDATVKVWNIASEQLVYSLEGHNGDITSVVFSPDGQHIASGAYDFMAILWDIETGTLVRRFEGHTLPIQSLVFSSDGRHLITASSDGTLILWDVATGALIRRFEGHRASVLAVTISNDDLTVLSGARDGTILLWDIATGEQIRQFSGNTTGVNDLQFSPDNTHFISASGDGTIFVWDIATGDIVSQFNGRNAEVRNIVFSPDGTLLYSAGVEGQVIIWDVASGLEIGYLNGHTDDVLGIAISDDGKMITTASKDRTVRVWNAGMPAIYKSFAEQNERITSLDYIEDTNQIIAASTDGVLYRLDIDSNQSTQINRWDVPLLAMAVAPQSQQALLGSREGWLQLVDLQTGDTIRELIGHTTTILSTTFIADETQAITTAQDGTVFRWDILTGAILQTYDGHQTAVYDVAIVPENQLITIDRNGISILWALDTGVKITEFNDHENAIYSVDAMQSMPIFATGSRDRSVIIRDTATNTEIARLLDERDTIWSIDFSDDDSRLAAGAADGAIVVWDVATDSELQRFELADVAVFDVQFIQDGEYIMAGYEDGRVVLWRSYTSEQLLEWVYVNRYIRDLDCLERIQYRIEPYCEPTS